MPPALLASNVIVDALHIVVSGPAFVVRVDAEIIFDELSTQPLTSVATNLIVLSYSGKS